MTRPSEQELRDENYLKEVNKNFREANKTNMKSKIISIVIVIVIFYGLFNVLPHEYNATILIVGIATTIITYFLLSISNMIYLMFRISNTSEYYEKYYLHYLEEINAKLELMNLNK